MKKQTKKKIEGSKKWNLSNPLGVELSSVSGGSKLKDRMVAY